MKGLGGQRYQIQGLPSTSKRTGYEIEYLINSKGLRDSETTYEKPEGIFRIVLVGDSHTFGYGVPIEKHYSTLLEGYFKDVEVINMGVDGYGVDQELIYLQLEGFKYEPDLVLAYVPHFAEHRHMHTNRFGKNKPRFLLVDGELELTHYPVVDNVSLLPQGILRDFHHWLLEKSVAYQILQNGILGIVRQGISQAEQKQQDENNSFNEKFVAEMNELGEELIVAMSEDSLKHGATFVLVTRMDKLQESALERQVISVNISRSLSNPAFSLPGNLKHENESGNGVIAWEIAKFLQNNHLIPADHLKD